VTYIAMTQTRNGPINGDISGVGASYDRNATFTSLSVFTSSMTPSQPTSSMSFVRIKTPVDASGVINDSEDEAVSVSGTATPSRWVRLVVADSTTGTVSSWVQANGAGVWSATVNLSTLAQGSLRFTADLVTDNNSTTVASGSIGATTTSLHDSVAPLVTIASVATAGTPTLYGTSDLPNGSLIAVTVDHDHDNATAQITYQTTVLSSAWSVATATVAPTAGTVPSGGFTSHAMVTVSATDAAGNRGTATALTVPTVTKLTSNDTTPTLTGTWTRWDGDFLQVKVNGVTYSGSNLALTATTWSLTVGIGAGVPLPDGTFGVIATVTRSTGGSIDDRTSDELVVDTTSIVTISGGDSTALTSNPTPVISGTTEGGPAGTFRVGAGGSGRVPCEGGPEPAASAATMVANMGAPELTSTSVKV
jgi:hypothetical protein